MTQKAVQITPSIKVGCHEKLLVIAGPCQIESLEHSRRIAADLLEITSRFPVNFVYKSSFDKANRTSGETPRGPGMQAGLEILSAIKSEFKIAVLTDVHTAEQAQPVSQCVDILQTPAFLCRQTDFLVAVGKTGKAVNVKKGQFLAPQDMAFAAEKISSTGNSKILLCERGTCFGYRDLVVDMRSLITMREAGYPIVFDATHSVQSMGGNHGATGGDRRFVSPLAQAAAAVGIDGLFLECHDNPDKAPSDGPNMLALSQIAPLLKRICAIREAALN